jgi:hypothetical protein
MTDCGNSTTVTLPGGYVDQYGVSHREVELSMLTGEDEYSVASTDASVAAAQLVTRLLARCVRRVGSIDEITPSLLREMLVSDRDYLLVKLRELTFGGKVECVMTCPQSDCAEKMDISLDLRQLGFESKPVNRRYFDVRLPRVEPGAETDAEELIEFRLPTGGDQESLSELFAQDPVAAADELFARCVSRDAAHADATTVAVLPREARPAVEEAIKRLSPDLEIEIEAVCPECGAAAETTLDFATHFLAELQLDLQGVEREVHFLAWHYHWSERDILSMTRGKRRRYVALLQGEIDRLNQVW